MEKERREIRGRDWGKRDRGRGEESGEGEKGEGVL